MSKESEEQEELSEEEFDIFKVEEEFVVPEKLLIFAKILDSLPFIVIVNTLTIYALFSDDTRILFFREPSDSVFDVITIIALLFFTFEIIASSLVKKDYWLSFFF